MGFFFHCKWKTLRFWVWVWAKIKRNEDGWSKNYRERMAGAWVYGGMVSVWRCKEGRCRRIGDGGWLGVMRARWKSNRRSGSLGGGLCAVFVVPHCSLWELEKERERASEKMKENENLETLKCLTAFFFFFNFLWEGMGWIWVYCFWVKWESMGF